MSGKLLLIHGSVTEVSSADYFGAKRRAEALGQLLRESLLFVPNGEWHRKVYEALGEPMPPLRKLKGKSGGK